MKKQPKPVLAWGITGMRGNWLRVLVGIKRDDIAVFSWEQLHRVRIVPVKPKRRTKK